MYVHVWYVWHIWVGALRVQKRVFGSPVTGDRGSCNQPDVVNETLVP